MRLLPHGLDGTCTNGRRHGSMPELRANGHLAHACTCGARPPPMDSTTGGSASTCTSNATSLATSSAIPNDGRDGRNGHAHLHFKHRSATKACSGPGAAQQHSQCSYRPGTLVFALGITARSAVISFARCACRAFGIWNAESIALYSWCASTAEHGTHGRRRRHAWHAQQPAWLVTSWQRCVATTHFPSHPCA